VRTLLADLVNSLPDFPAIFNLEQFALWRVQIDRVSTD
jgi:hypothetical protein